MGRIIFGTALAGWTGIVALAWHQANDRIAIACGTIMPDGECLARFEAKRDAILTGGLTVGLLIILAGLFFGSAYLIARRGARPVGPKAGWSPASRGNKALPR